MRTTTKTLFKSGTAIAALAVASFTSTAAKAQDGYFVDALGDAPGGDFWSRAFGMNDAGWIVGESKITTGDDPQKVAVLWRPFASAPEILNGANATQFSRTTTINNSNFMGGFAQQLQPFEPPKAFVYRDGETVDYFLDDPDIKNSRMSNVTDSGMVVGYLIPMDPDISLRGYVYDPVTADLTVLQPLPPVGNLSLAHGMNADGTVVGAASDSPDTKPHRVAVVWEDGETEPTALPGMGAFAQYDDVAASWIGDDGRIRGNAGNRDAEETLFAQNEVWMWDPNTEIATSLGFLDGFDWVKVRGSNADGSVLVGYAYQDGLHRTSELAQRVGVIWTEADGWVDVNTMLVGGESSFHIAEITGVADNGTLCATAINDFGQVEAVRLSRACLTLKVDGMTVGQNATITVNRGMPGKRVVVLVGFDGPSTHFNNVDGWCATFGFGVRMNRGKVRVAFTGYFDHNGDFVRQRHVREEAGGKDLRFQAAERDTCPFECMSNVAGRFVD